MTGCQANTFGLRLSNAVKEMAFEMETAIVDFLSSLLPNTSPSVVVRHQKFALILFLITTLHLLLLPAVSFLPGETFVRPFAGKTGMLIRNI